MKRLLFISLSFIIGFGSKGQNPIAEIHFKLFDNEKFIYLTEADKETKAGRRKKNKRYNPYCGVLADSTNTYNVTANKTDLSRYGKNIKEPCHYFYKTGYKNYYNKNVLYIGWGSDLYEFIITKLQEKTNETDTMIVIVRNNGNAISRIQINFKVGVYDVDFKNIVGNIRKEFIVIPSAK